MAIAGYNVLVTVATSASSTYAVWNGIKSFKIGDSRDQLDITDFNDGNVRARLAALRDVKVDASGDYEPGDTGCQRVQACYTAGTSCVIQVIIPTPGGGQSTGFAYILQIGNIDYNASVDGKVEIASNLMIDATSGTAIFSLP